MKVFLLYRDHDFDPEQPLPPQAAELTQDLALDTLFDAMSKGDKFLRQVAQRVLFAGADDPETVLYRQAILRDALDNPALVRQIYQITLEVQERKRRNWLGVYGRSATSVLSGAVELLQMFVELLRELRSLADRHAGQFRSEGFTRFFAMVQAELDDRFFAEVEEHLKRLRFRDGVLISARLGPGNEAADYLLRLPNPPRGGLAARLLPGRSPVYTFRLHPRDEHGGRALGEIKEQGLNSVANAVAQSADHIDSFFAVLRTELAFYVGCLNLAEQLAQLGAPIAFPEPAAVEARRLSGRGLYDPCLALTAQRRPVGNDVQADGKALAIVTGANQGGKSTFLRSVGLAQLMLQCGMFVAAEAYRASLCRGLFTHYRREEDATMTSGKLDEELARMSAIVDRLRPGALLLLNESFAATNEREGSEIARQIIRALVERGVRVFFVTHLYDFAQSWRRANQGQVLFLRAERLADGTRTFRMVEGEPLETSFGQDVYQAVFGAAGNGSRPEAQAGPQRVPAATAKG